MNLLSTLDFVQDTVNTLLTSFLLKKSLPSLETESEKNNIKPKYQKSRLPKAKQNKVEQLLLTAMESEKIYLQPNLNLSQLSKRFKTTTHNLSQILNESIGCTFLEFVNGYRVKEAIIKLKDKKYQHYTIIAIGYDVGFNSKTAFYTAFKKKTNTTPGNYRKS